MKLNKLQFIKYVETYKKMLYKETNIINALGDCIEWEPGNWINNYYKLLSDMCELKENNIFGTSLDWFCYETDFGTHDNMINIMDNGKHKIIYINNAEDLYNYIIKYEIKE